MTLLLAYKTN